MCITEDDQNIWGFSWYGLHGKIRWVTNTGYEPPHAETVNDANSRVHALPEAFVAVKLYFLNANNLDNMGGQGL